MNKIAITSGEAFIDIDAYACAIAYQELLHKEGKEAQAILTGPLNHSVPPPVRSWATDFLKEAPGKDFDVVIVDLSDPKYIAKFADQERVIEIYDHHFGFEKYWREKLGDKSHIEMIGACATLIWEQFVKRGYSADISEVSANLLATAIISNTLNFQGPITDKRDINAFKELQRYTTLTHDWVKQYYRAQELVIREDVKQAIIYDTKVKKIPNLGLTVVIGQIELWDGKNFIREFAESIREGMESFGEEKWCFSSPSISDNKNFIYATDHHIKKLLEKTISCKFNGDMGETSRLWLRKEIVKNLHGSGN